VRTSGTVRERLVKSKKRQGGPKRGKRRSPPSPVGVVGLKVVVVPFPGTVGVVELLGAAVVVFTGGAVVVFPGGAVVVFVPLGEMVGCGVVGSTVAVVVLGLPAEGEQGCAPACRPSAREQSLCSPEGEVPGPTVVLLLGAAVVAGAVLVVPGKGDTEVEWCVVELPEGRLSHG
jgi:hypothetical protein